jgi:hypothetical protein
MPSPIPDQIPRRNNNIARNDGSRKQIITLLLIGFLSQSPTEVLVNWARIQSPGFSMPETLNIPDPG